MGPDRGLGVVTLQDIPEGSLVGEYVGLHRTRRQVSRCFTQGVLLRVRSTTVPVVTMRAPTQGGDAPLQCTLQYTATQTGGGSPFCNKALILVRSYSRVVSCRALRA